MGFDFPELGDFERCGLLVRWLKRPVCSETWDRRNPDFITRSQQSGPYARVITKRRVTNPPRVDMTHQGTFSGPATPRVTCNACQASDS